MGSYASQARTFFYNLERYGLKISKKELQQMLITIAVIAFVWSFNRWGAETFDVAQGIKNLMLGALYGAIGLLVNQLGQRLVAVYYGYDPNYEYGVLGLMTAVVVAFASRGLLIFFMPGAINIRHLAASRLGEFRYYTNDWEWAKAGFTGPFFNVLLAISLAFFRENPLVADLIKMNLMFAFYSLLPLPGNVGLYLFYPHVHFWSFTVGIVVGSALSIFFLPPILTFFIGIIFGIGFIYYHYVRIDGNLKPPFEH